MQCRVDLQDGKKTRQELRDRGLSYLDEIERLQAQLAGKNPTERLDEAYSQRAEEELFTFVLHPEIPGDNNESERELRRDATARKTGRTNKTPHGAKRRSIISSVLQSIGKQLGKLNLDAIIQEVNRWKQCGHSCFEEMAHATSRHPPPETLIMAAIQRKLAKTPILRSWIASYFELINNRLQSLKHFTAQTTSVCRRAPMRSLDSYYLIVVDATWIRNGQSGIAA